MKRPRLSLYQKFALVIICVGIIPIGILSTVILNRMFKEYQSSLYDSYEQSIRYATFSLESLIDSYNDISKICYYYSYSSEGNFQYNYMNFDNLRRILLGVNYPPEEREQRVRFEMDAFLGNVIQMSSDITSVHFLAGEQKTADGEDTVDFNKFYHKGDSTSFFKSEETFEETVRVDELDYESRKMIMIPPHLNNYYSSKNDMVLTIARNYYDITGVVGKENYVGTLFVDFSLEQMDAIFENINIYDTGTVYICNDAGECFYSNDSEVIGKNLKAEGIAYQGAENDTEFFLDSELEKYDLNIYLKMDVSANNQRMRETQKLMYLFVAAALTGILFGSVVFSKRLTRPIRNMMEYMSQIENGQFKVELPVESDDEIGVLSQRFNQMSTELEKYINQSYVAQIKQTKAELNALKSQIYPHFLYNTLEVIRMTAISHRDEMVGRMVESLADQIRYIIGNVDDVVPMSDEIEILQKYIYLINCRFGDKVNFVTEIGKLSDKKIPKLILQPIVENAFIHGIKPKAGKGRILLTAEMVLMEGKEERIEISVLDNGIGMTEKAKNELEELLMSNQPGKKIDYRWESTGLKNVHDRLRFLYGPEYGIIISSNPGIGTAVKVTIPGNIGEDKEHVENDFS